MEKDPLILSLKKEPPKTHVEMAPAPHVPFPKSILAALVIVLLLLGAGWYVYGGALFGALRAPSSLSMTGLSTSTILEKKGPVVTLSEAELLQKVGKLMALPQNEEPTIAVVADLAPLQSQAFFRNARVGDIVLMYKKSLRAILYDPDLDKIQEVAPITVSNK